MSTEERDGGEIIKIIRRAIIIATIIGVLVAVIIFTMFREEAHSALYLLPDSYSNYIEGDKVSFIYGIKCAEKGKTRYLLEIYVGDILVSNKEIELNSGETLEQKAEIHLPSDISFPLKVTLILRVNNNTEEVHFWLKGRKYGT